MVFLLNRHLSDAMGGIVYVLDTRDNIVVLEETQYSQYIQPVIGLFKRLDQAMLSSKLAF